MKAKSTILTLAAAVIGFAFVTPDVSAKPPSKTPGMSYVKKKNAEKRKRAAAKTPAKQYWGKTIGLSVNKRGSGKGATRRSWRGFRKGRR